MANDDAADRGRRDGRNVLRSELIGNRARKLCRYTRMLQHQRALQIDGAVQAARQDKVAFKQRTCFSELLNYFISLQMNVLPNVSTRWKVSGSGRGGFPR